MAHNFPKISAPFGRNSPKDRLVDRSIFAKPWVQMFYESGIKMYASEKIDGTSVGIVWDGERISLTAMPSRRLRRSWTCCTPGRR